MIPDPAVVPSPALRFLHVFALFPISHTAAAADSLRRGRTPKGPLCLPMCSALKCVPVRDAESVPPSLKHPVLHFECLSFSHCSRAFECVLQAALTIFGGAAGTGGRQAGHRSAKCPADAQPPGEPPYHIALQKGAPLLICCIARIPAADVALSHNLSAMSDFLAAAHSAPQVHAPPDPTQHFLVFSLRARIRKSPSRADGAGGAPGGATLLPGGLPGRSGGNAARQRPGRPEALLPR